MDYAPYSSLLDALGYLIVVAVLFLPVPYLAWIALKTAVNWRKYEQTGYTLETPLKSGTSAAGRPEVVPVVVQPGPGKRAA
jgi:hypothetical protein